MNDHGVHLMSRKVSEILLLLRIIQLRALIFFINARQSS